MFRFFIQYEIRRHFITKELLINQIGTCVQKEMGAINSLVVYTFKVFQTRLPF